jgi:hypothetical protein
MNITNEINDLEQRRTALHEYLKSDEFKTLPPNVQDWRRMQEGAMEQYARALTEIKRLAPEGYLDGQEQPKAATAASAEQDEVPENHPARQRADEARKTVQEAVRNSPRDADRTVKKDAYKDRAPVRKARQQQSPRLDRKVVSRKKK